MRHGNERWVDGCDSIEEAVKRGCRKLAKKPDALIWISDAENQVVMDKAELARRCAAG